MLCDIKLRQIHACLTWLKIWGEELSINCFNILLHLSWYLFISWRRQTKIHLEFCCPRSLLKWKQNFFTNQIKLSLVGAGRGSWGGRGEGKDKISNGRGNTGSGSTESSERWGSEGEVKNVKFCHTRTRTQNVFSCLNRLWELDFWINKAMKLLAWAEQQTCFRLTFAQLNGYDTCWVS